MWSSDLGGADGHQGCLTNIELTESGRDYAFSKLLDYPEIKKLQSTINKKPNNIPALELNQNCCINIIDPGNSSLTNIRQKCEQTIQNIIEGGDSGSDDPSGGDSGGDSGDDNSDKSNNKTLLIVGITVPIVIIIAILVYFFAF